MKKKILLTPIALVASLMVSGVYAQDKVLSPVVVSGAQDYVVESTSSVTRFDTPIQQIPQSVVALPKQIFDDQGSQTVSDALRNVSNVNTVDSRDQNNTGFKIRGFKAGMVVDGVPTAGFFHNHENLSNVETLTVIKGPSGDTYSGQGAGSQDTSGGTIFIETLSPKAKQSFSATGTVGSYSKKGISFDYNQPLNDKLAIRVGAEKIDSDTNVDRVFFKRESMYAAIGLTENKDRNISLKFRSFDNSTLDYYGLPRASLSSNEINPAVSRSTFFGANGQPNATTKGNSSTFNWTENLADDLSTSFIASKQSYKLSQPGPGFTPIGIDYFVLEDFTLPTWNTGYQGAGTRPVTLTQNIDSTYLSPSITKKFSVGQVINKLIAGYDYQKTTDTADFWGIPGSFDAQLWNYSTGLYPSWVNPTRSTYHQENNYVTRAPFVNGQIDLDKLHLFYGLKRTDYEINQTGRTNTTSKNSTRFGASYDLSKQVTAFVGAGQSSRMPIGSTFAPGVVAKPEETSQDEIGFKFNSASGLTGVISLFDITKKNAPMVGTVSDGYGGFFSVQEGIQESQGLDLDLIWKVNNSWTNLLAYTNQQAKYKVDRTYAGKQLFLVPEETLRIATRYEFKQGAYSGLGLGFGLTYRSELPGDYTNTFFTPSVTTYDAQASYQLDKTSTVRLFVNNLFDKQYVEPMAYFNGGRVMPALGRTIMANLTLKF
jgi:iron complex outermembrane receptor protein